MPEAEAAAGSEGKTTLAQFLRYVQYIHEKPEWGVDVLLQGFEDAKFTRKVEPVYRIKKKALKVNVWGKVLSKYQSTVNFSTTSD